MTQEHSEKVFDLACDMLADLHKKSENLWRNGKTLNGKNVSSSILDNREALSWTKPPITETHLTNALEEGRASRSLLLGYRPYFYLPPLEINPQFIPLLFVKYNLSKRPPEINLRVRLIRVVDKKPQEKQVYGLRFEKQERKETYQGDTQIISRHDYWHAQTTTWTDDTETFPEWIPENIPCVPTRAENPISLALCMLISLYGRGVYSKIFADTGIDGEYTKCLGGIL